MQLFDGGVAIAGLFGFVAGRGQREREPASQRVVIVCNKNTSHKSARHFQRIHASVCSTGSVTRKHVPRSGVLLTSMRPSCASTIFRTIASPSPEPCGLVVKNGLKILSATSADTPGPVSVTSTITVGTGA